MSNAYTMNSVAFIRTTPTAPNATYFVQVGVEKKTGITENTYLGVRAGDILTVTRTLPPVVGSLVLAVCNSKLALCRYTEHEGKRFLVCGEKRERPIEITKVRGASIWGVVSALSRHL